MDSTGLISEVDDKVTNWLQLYSRGNVWFQALLIMVNIVKHRFFDPHGAEHDLWYVCGLAGPPCGPIGCNERLEALLKEIKPHLQTLKEKLNTVTSLHYTA